MRSDRKAPKNVFTWGIVARQQTLLLVYVTKTQQGGLGKVGLGRGCTAQGSNYKIMWGVVEWGLIILHNHNAATTVYMCSLISQKIYIKIEFI